MPPALFRVFRLLCPLFFLLSASFASGAGLDARPHSIANLCQLLLHETQSEPELITAIEPVYRELVGIVLERGVRPNETERPFAWVQESGSSFDSIEEGFALLQSIVAEKTGGEGSEGYRRIVAALSFVLKEMMDASAEEAKRTEKEAAELSDPDREAFVKLQAWPRLGAREVSLVTRPHGPGWGFQVAPDGKTVAVAFLDTGFALANAATGAPIRIIDPPGDPRGGLEAISFSEDGSRVAALWKTGQIEILNARTGELLWSQGRHNDPTAPLFNTEGIIFLGSDRLLVLTHQGSAPANRAYVTHQVRFSGQAAIVERLPWQGEYVGTVDEGKAAVLRTGRSSFVSQPLDVPTWSPTALNRREITLSASLSSELMAGVQGERWGIWRWDDLDGEPLLDRPLTESPSEAIISILPNLGQIAAWNPTTKRVEFWSIDERRLIRETKVLRVRGRSVQKISISPDGRHAVIAAGGSRFELWDAQTWDRMAIQPNGLVGGLHGVEWADDGKTLMISGHMGRDQCVLWKLEEIYR